MNHFTSSPFAWGYRLSRVLRVGGDRAMNTEHRTVRRALVAARDSRLRADASSLLRARRLHVTEARSLHEAVSLLTGCPDVLLFEVHLAGPRWSDLIDAANETMPTPIRIAMGADVSPAEAFELAQRGVSSFLSAPIVAADLQRALDQAGEPEAYRYFLPDVVGVQSAHAVQTAIREIMTRQALALSRGNRGRAARLLGVSRQAVHQMIRRPASPDEAPPPRPPEPRHGARGHLPRRNNPPS